MRKHPRAGEQSGTSSPASAFLPETAGRDERTLYDIEVEAGALERRVSIGYLDTRVQAVNGAHVAGDQAALRAELVNLAAAAANWAAELPAPRRSVGRGQSRRAA